MTREDNDAVWHLECTCPVCRTPVVLVAELPWRQFRHLDHEPFAPGPLNILACPRCGVAGAETTNIELIYQDPAYVARKPSINKVHPPGGGPTLMAPDHQANLIANRLSAPPQSILDFGCFDGRLARALARLYPGARVVAFDVNEGLRRFFPATGGIEFVSAELSQVTGEFDLVTISQSLMYVRQPKELLLSLAAQLRPGGAIFIQVPDTGKKPSNLLFGDLHHHFTRAGLLNLLTLSGLTGEVMEPTAFPRDLLVLARAGTDGVLQPPGDTIYEAVRQVQQLGNRIQCSSQPGVSYHVLGTTIDAAFVAEVLGDAVIGFVDESPFEPGSLFRGRSLNHPDALQASDTTILPLGPAATPVLQRFENAYEGKFILI